MSGNLIEQIHEHPTDQARWAAWYKSVYPKLYYVAYRLSKGRVDAAQDLVSEAFERFIGYRAIDRVVNDQHALAYLITTCRNLATDRYANQDQHLEPLPDDIEAIAVTEPRPESKIDLDRMIQALSPQDRNLVQWMRDGVGLSEIAARLGVTYSAAGVRLHRIRKRLRESYG